LSLALADTAWGFSSKLCLRRAPEEMTCRQRVRASRTAGTTMRGPSGPCWTAWAAALQEDLMKRQGRLAILLVLLALAACAQGAIGQMPTPYAPASPQNNGDRNMDM